MATKYHRVLLKLSGEVLLNRASGRCIDPDVVAKMAAKVKALKNMGCDVAIVLGGGNIFRGATGEALGIDRCAGDYMGMLATVINALALQHGYAEQGACKLAEAEIRRGDLAEPERAPCGEEGRRLGSEA